MTDATALTFPVPAGLRWSAATAAFQVEGARRADGRGRSIWDDFVDTDGLVKDGSTAEPGPDSYRRSNEDIALLQGLGVDSYRFSISWVRVQPDGRGPAQPAGLAYYDRLVDGLLDAGIEPFPTLYHWDLPSVLELSGGWLQPATGSEADQSAAHVYDLIHNRLFADPVLTGAYPDLAALGVEMPVHDGDMELISTASEFCGINFYNPTTIAAAPEGAPVPFVQVPTPGVAHTGFGELWGIQPHALTTFLTDAAQRYGDRLPPIIIGENGASFPEPDEVSGTLADDRRIDYLASHIGAVADAVAQGVRVDEYTVWSLLDNFEWADGFAQRFGLVHVDQQTSKRTPKASYEWYRSLIAEAKSARARA